MNPYERTARIFPVLTFITFFINSLFIIYKGSPQLDLDEMPIGDSIGISIGIATLTAFIAWFIYLPYAKRKIEKTFNPEIELGTMGNEDLRTISYRNAMPITNTVTESSSDGPVEDDGQVQDNNTVRGES